MRPYQVRTFGGWSLLGPDGEPIEAVRAHSKGGAVLAYLATRPVGEVVDRAELLPLLWPDWTEEEGRRSLRSLLTRLRGRLPEGALGGKGEDRLWLEEAVLTSDVRRFERARQEGHPREALGLYRGPFLEHFHLADASPFNRWAEERRSAYRRRAYGAALAVGEASRAAGELEKAKRAYRRALKLAPLKERAAAGLIRVLAARGQRADALQLYESFRDRLEEELELTPSEELDELAKRVRSAPKRDDSQKGRREVADDATAIQRETVGSAAEEIPSPRRTSRRIAVTATLLVLAAVGTGLWYGVGGGESDQVPALATERPKIAVAPFSMLGDSREARPLLKGLHASLLTRLSNVSGLAVLSRTSVTNFQGSHRSAMAVADSLGAEWVVEGEAQLVGDEVQVNAQLIDTDTRTQAWAASYRRSFSVENLFAIQTDITRRIVQSLEAKLTPAEEERVARRPTSDLDAYRLYSRGRGLLVRRTDSSIVRAEELFRQVIARDSAFAPAWAALANALALREGYANADPNSVFPRVRKAARRALALDPQLAEAHMALALVQIYQMRAPAGLRRLRRAVQIEPSYAKAYHGLNMLHLTVGRPEEALPFAQKAVALSPLSPENQQGLARAALAVGDYERALRAARRARQIEPGYPTSFIEGYALYRLGRLTERDTVVAQGVRRRLLALAEAASGNEAPARNLLAEYKRRLDSLPFTAGLLQAALGRRKKAIMTFAQAFQRQETSAGSIAMILRYHYPEVLGPLREEPGWKELTRQINVGWGLNPDGSLPDSVDVSVASDD